MGKVLTDGNGDLWYSEDAVRVGEDFVKEAIEKIDNEREELVGYLSTPDEDTEQPASGEITPPAPDPQPEPEQPAPAPTTEPTGEPTPAPQVIEPVLPPAAPSVPLADQVDQQQVPQPAPIVLP